MTFRRNFLFAFIILNLLAAAAFGQVDSVIGQLSSSAAESFAGGISGDGRFVVFESRGNLATENPRNTDNNVEIFLFDYAQRRIFQITDTKSVLFDTSAPAIFSNIRVEITNTRPVISNDGRWIAFGSNATTSTPAVPDSTNPGLFDGNAFTSPTPTPTPTGSPTPTPTASPTPAPNPLTGDGNLEMWLYEIPDYPPVTDLSAGDEIALANLSPFNPDGTPNTTEILFTRVTNTDASQTPRPGTTTTGPFVADDNHDASISIDGSVIAFVSTRDLVPSVGNPPPPPLPGEDNDEIFTYSQGLATLGQVTKTPRGIISDPIYNKNPTISGDGLRVVFASTGDDPIDDPASTTNFDTGSNPETSRNEEIFYADLVAGNPTGGRQITTTTPTNPGDPVNILDLGRRMSRDGRYIAFDSYADLGTTPPGANSPAFALFVYDVTDSSFRQVGPRSNADAAALGGDVQHYPGFTDYDASGVPQTLVLETRLNIKADGTIPAVAADGLNPDPIRPAQIYSYTLNVPVTVPPTPPTFTRLAKFPSPNSFIASTQLLPGNTIERMAFNLALTELGLGNFDQQSEVFYYLRPEVVNETIVSFNLYTGASRQLVTMTPLPSPSPTATSTPTASPTATETPTPTPTATPSPTPTGSPSPTSTPTPIPTPPPVTPPAVLGISPGMLAILDVRTGRFNPAPRTGVGSISRSFNLPIELSGVTMAINGAACGLKSVSRNEIIFVAPPALASALAGTTYKAVVNNNGAVFREDITIVPARPDIFNREMIAGPGGRAKLFNVTNTVFTTEPFTVRTIRRRGNRLVPSVIRIYITGVANLSSNSISVRIRDSVISGAAIRSNPVLFEPGVYTFDFELPPALDRAGDQPIVVTVNFGSVSFSSRLDDTAARVFIL